ncbi:MAG: hypothetical protein LLG40_02155 [Deltaproteobacteria bacterium]|nr:hypothetical protein [Deltaproteobacteria bacterium]
MKTSDKILLGIYNHWPRLDDSISFKAGELAWVAHHRLGDWRQKNGWKEVIYPADKGSNDSYMDKPLTDISRVSKELSILQANDCIKFVQPSGFDTMFKVQLLPNGLIRAEKLSSWRGRADLWYSENRNGIIGLAVTIIVSIITAWITSIIAAKRG